MIGFASSILAGTTLVRAAIQSPNYVPGVSGWTINQDGSAEFNSVTVRGQLFVAGPGGSFIRIFNNGVFPQINFQPEAYTDPAPAAAGQGPGRILADAIQDGLASRGRIQVISPEFTAPGFSNALLRLIGESFDSSVPSNAALIGDTVSLVGSTSVFGTLDTAGAVSTASTITAAGLINGGYTYVDTQIFTASGNFTKASYPTGKLARVQLCGGGGGGGGADATGAAQWAFGDGGGGGESGMINIPFTSLGTSETVTVGGGGAGGAGAATGTNGAASSFGTVAFITCNGGGGGSPRAANSTVGAFSSGNGRTGGTGGTGGTRWRGGAGTNGQGYGTAVTQVRGGDGGATAYTGAVVGALANNAGNAGGAYGGGGSGAANSVSQATRTGGAGSAGIVIVDIYA